MSERRQERRAAELAARRRRKRRRKSGGRLERAMDDSFGPNPYHWAFGLIFAIGATIRDWWASRRNLRVWRRSHRP